jgi:glycosyltransferase involved in cell wall biosynthesis
LNPPLISVLFPVYNAGLFLEHALISIFFQTYQNFEIIAIDDCSTDNSLEILYKYQEKNNRIKIIKNERNLGLIDSLNIGLTHCSGDYIARMDPDDYIDKERFKKQIDFLTIHHDFDAVSSWMESFDEKGFLKIIKYRENIKDIKATLLFYSPVSHAASIFRASILKELAYRPEYKYAEDYDLWFRFLQKYKVGVIQEVY